MLYKKLFLFFIIFPNFVIGKIEHAVFAEPEKIHLLKCYSIKREFFEKGEVNYINESGECEWSQLDLATGAKKSVITFPLKEKLLFFASEDPELAPVIQAICKHMQIKEYVPVLFVEDSVGFFESLDGIADTRELYDDAQKLKAAYICIPLDRWKTIPSECKIWTLYHELRHVQQIYRYSEDELLEMGEQKREIDAEQAAGNHMNCEDCLSTLFYARDNARNDEMVSHGYFSKKDLESLIVEKAKHNKLANCQAHSERKTSARLSSYLPQDCKQK